MEGVKIVINKDGSETAYIPVELTDLFTEILEAGQRDIFETEPERFEGLPEPLFNWETR